MTLIRPELGITVIPGKLFLHTLQDKPPDTISDHYFLFDDCKQFLFEPMSRENGPPILTHIQEFIKLIKDKLTKINKQIHICVSLGPESRVNCIFMLCAFLILERDFINRIISQTENKRTSRAKSRIIPDYDHPLTIFSDVYPPIEEYEDATSSPFTITLSDALNGFIKGCKNGWFDLQRFDDESYNFYLAPENGFMTWIVPNRLLVLASPGTADSPLLFDMLPLFRKWHIYTVVFFTTEMRGAEDLARVGIDKVCYDAAQDSLPTIQDVLNFCELCDKGQAVAICSLNGLGRGPMFAAAWLIHSFGFQPKEAIGWVRCVRQGSIYGIQQDFLMRVDRTLHPESAALTQQKSGPTIHMRNTKRQSRLAATGSALSKKTTSRAVSKISTYSRVVSRLSSPKKSKSFF